MPEIYLDNNKINPAWYNWYQALPANEQSKYSHVAEIAKAQNAYVNATTSNSGKENDSSGVGNGGFSWANLAIGIPGAINNAKEVLSEEPKYRGTVWGDNGTYKKNPWQIGGAILGTGKASFYARNPWANPEVQGMIGSEKNKFDAFEGSLNNMDYRDLNSLAQAQNQFGNLGFNKTLRDFGGDRTFGDKLKSIGESTAAGAASGSIGGLWGMLGGAATGLTEGILANSDYGNSMGVGALATSLIGGDPISGAIFGRLFGKKQEDRDAKAKAMRNEFLQKQNYLNQRKDATFTLQKNNIMSNNMRNMRKGIVAAFGGNLSTQGGDWTDGLTFIDNGDSHEENLFGGVPMGIAPDGQPNIVEQNEVVWNDYVFSDRIDVPEELRKKYKLGGELTFSSAVKKLQKSAEERPNDPIEKRTLDNILTELAQEQEVLRQQKEVENTLIAMAYAYGGGLSREKDYGSKKKPYPKVKSGDFAGGGRSYPIPTKADAIDALRLAGLHHRPDVKAKVYKKYPELKKAFGGHLHAWGDYLSNPALVTGMIGLGQAFAYNYPSYTSERNAIAQNAMNMLPNVSYQPLSGKLAYEPMDVTVPLAVQEANNAATRSAIRANVNNNRQAAINSLLASNWNDNIAAGALYQQALNDNYARKRDVAAFNLGIDKDNASMFLDTSKINAEQAARRANMYLPTALSNIEEQKENWYQKRANIANAISRLGTNLAAQHKSLQERDWNDMLLNTGYYGTIPLTMKPKHWTKKQWETYQENIKKYKDENELWKYFLENQDKIMAQKANNKSND